jgi:hypothetical protein
MTPVESLRHQCSQRSHNSEATENSPEDASTAASTATASKLSDGRMSTSSAKLRELDAVIQRQKKTNEKKDAQNSERISLIERQLHRINNLDSKLDEVKTDFGHRLHLFETRMVDTVKGQIESSNHNLENMNTSMEKLMSVVNKLVQQSGIDRESSQELTKAHDRSNDSTELLDRHKSSEGAKSDSTSSSSRSSMSTESIAVVKSPEHKRLKSGKKSAKESVRRHLHLALEVASHSPVSPTIDQQESFDSLDLAMQQMEEIVQADISKTESSQNSNVIPDPESQDITARPTSNVEMETNAPPSLG